jgi:hypothetical protein
LEFVEQVHPGCDYFLSHGSVTREVKSLSFVKGFLNKRPTSSDKRRSPSAFIVRRDLFRLSASVINQAETLLPSSITLRLAGVIGADKIKSCFAK